jgi:hypothetical protein
MPMRVVDLRTERPCLGIASFGRRGPEGKLTPSEVAFIATTARRVPEVMIKVSGGARTLQGVGAHFDYIGRKGVNEIETDMGEKLMEWGFEKDLMLDWDLDLDVLRRHTDRAIAHGRKHPKLVHNVIFSMPKGTPSDKLATEVRAFAVNQFALKHRYAMALHTHQGNPHVHLVVRAISEQGVRLNIRKATLVATRREVEQGWYVVHDVLERDGHSEVARDVRRFLARMLSPRTERQQITLDVLAKQKAKRKVYSPRTR